MRAIISLLVGTALFTCVLLENFWPALIAIALITIWLLLKNITLPQLQFINIIKNKWLWISLILLLLAGLTIYWISVPSSPETTKPAQWHMRWEKPPSYKGTNPHERAKEFNIALHPDGNGGLVIFQYYDNMGTRRVCRHHLVRSLSNPKMWSGTWIQDYPRDTGKITLTFRRDGKSAYGLINVKTNKEEGTLIVEIWEE